MANPLAGKPLRYKIGTDNPGPGHIGEILEVGYDIETPPPVGLSIAYGNLLDERNEGRFPPYREQTGTAKQYDEGVPDANGPGFEANLKEQFERRKLQGFHYIELDNPDAYKIWDVIRATDLARVYGLGVIAKNPLSMDEDATAWLRHQNVFGVIVEKDAGTPDQMQVMRTASGKPDLPIWFVFFGDGLAAARACAIRAGKFANMSVTYDRAAEEYGGEIEDFQLPKTQEPFMAWRLAKSLETLRDQVNAKWPGRDKCNDGTIGDTSHQATKSDHNPNSADVVTAMDITNDPAHGLVARSLAEALVASRDPRIKYIISNAQIISSTVSPWVWRPYSGSNAHREHVHISVMAEPSLYDDVRPWAATAGPPAGVALESGKGSWYSQYSGKYEWVDDGDAPGSSALGVPDDAQGVAFYNQSTLGKWFEVHAPNGKVSTEQQTDTGPHPNTGRSIDIAACAAERFGYSPKNFPTDSIFSWRQIPAPAVVAGLSPQQQAVKYRDLRTETVMADPNVQVLPPVNAELKKIWDQLAPQLMPIIAQAFQTIVQDALQRVLANQSMLLPPPKPAETVTPPPVTTVPATAGSALGVLAGIAGKALPMLGLQGSVWGTAILWGLQALDVVGTAGGATAAPTGGAITAGLAGTALSSIAAMVGRFFNKKQAPTQ